MTFATPSAGSIGSVIDNADGTYSATYTAAGSTGTIIITPKLSGTDFSNKAYVIVGSQYIIDGTMGNNAVTHAFSTTGNLTLSQGLFVDYLIVGGGGGGANTTAGGGGGGGVQQGTASVVASSYSVTIGTGGAGGWPSGTNGGSSSALSITAGGGAGGGSSRNGGNSGTPQSMSGGSGWTASGTDGAAGGGGAGAGGAGSNGATNSKGGDGGGGLASSITGTSVIYAGGGGGGNEYLNSGVAGSGGSGGGGNGGQGFNDSRKNGANATGYGSGGGGGGAFSGAGGSGSSGLVVLRYQGNSVGNVGGTVTSGTVSASGYTLHTFTSSGSFNLSSLNLNSRLGSTLSGILSGSGNLTYTGSGQLTLTANNTYTGETIITGGTVQVGLNGTTGSLGGSRFDIRSGATLAFSRSDNVSLTNTLYLPGTGTRTLRNIGAGILTFSGSSNITGESANPATLAISGSGSTVIQQSIASGGEAINLVKSESGILTLASSSNGYTGTTIVNGGTLKVSGQTGTGAVTVNSGAILTGPGTVKGATTIQSGATLVTDQMISQMTIDNSLTLAGGSNINWKVSSASGAAGTDWDHIQVNGALNITANSSSKCNINLWSILPNGSNGEIANFLPTENSYTWTILTTTGGITGFTSNAFNIVITPSNGTGGVTSSYNIDGFSIIQDGNALKLQYSPPLTQTIDATDNLNENISTLNFTTNTSTGSLNVGLGFFIDYLLIGGGGGGGSNSAGGGGAGGFRSGSTFLAASSHAITVGSGGAGGTVGGSGANGGNTTAFSITVGGGSGASRTGGNSGIPQSNSGASGWTSGGGDGAAGGGGSGSGGIGSIGGVNSVGGNGGIGTSSSITGNSVTYAAGGGGGNEYTAGAAAAGTGGTGGGGNGGQGFNDARKNGASATSFGSGGGGGGAYNGAGGSGSGGIAIVRYRGSSLGSIGGSVTTGSGTASGYTIHSFTSGGSFNMSSVNLHERLRATMSGNIIGSGNLIYNGPGILALTGTNSTYTGTTSITAGALNIRHASSLGTTTNGTTVSAGAALELQSGITLGAEPITINSDGISSGGSLRNISGDNTFGGTVTLASASRINSDAGTLTLNASNAITATNINLTIGGAGNTTVSGTITTGSGTLTKDGSGTLTLSGENTYTGSTTVSAGVLNIQNAQGTGTTAGGVTVASGAALELQGGISVGSEALTINNSGISNGGALRNISGDNTWGGTVTLSTNATRINSDAGTLILNASNAITATNINLTVGGAGNTAVSGTITTGTGTLTKDGNGKVILSGTNTYTGATTVSAGVLNIQNAQGTGTTAGGVTVASGAALELQGGITVGAEALTINNTGISIGGALRNISGDNTWGGTVTLSTNATRINSDAGTLTLNSSNAITASNINLTIGGAGNTTVSGTITTGTGALTKDGSGTLTLTGANTYTGTTTVSAGTLVLNRSGGTTIPATNNVTVSGGTLRISSDQALNNLTVSGGTLIVDNGVALTVNGTFTGGGTVQNDGSMIIKGSTFPGSTTTISSMTNLEINRSTGVTLDQSMTVAGTLTLTDGKLSLGSVDLTVSGSISGATSTKYIVTTGTGTLRRNITNNGSFVFPVGNSTYNPITVTNKTGSADDFSIKVIDEVYANGSSGTLVTTTNRVKRTWDITKATANGGSGVDLLLNWTPGTDVNGTISIPKLYHYESPAWAKKSTTGNTTYDVAAGTLTFTGYTGSFSPFAIMDDGAALPVNWLSFTGRPVHGAVELNWSTASEQNNSHFEVERSADALQFSKIGRVAASLTPNIRNDYQYLDQSPIPARSFYRLKQVDLDGKFSYSSIIQINGELATGISAWVIPGTNRLFVVIPQSLQGVSELSIYNASGKALQRQQILPGRSEINLSGVTSGGVYFIKLIKGNVVLYTSQFIN